MFPSLSYLHLSPRTPPENIGDVGRKMCSGSRGRRVTPWGAHGPDQPVRPDVGEVFEDHTVTTICRDKKFKIQGEPQTCIFCKPSYFRYILVQIGRMNKNNKE